MHNNIKFYLFSMLLFMIILCQNHHLIGQNTSCHRGRFDIGAELQVYPAGIIPTITSNYFFIDNIALRTRIGANVANRRDLSPFNDKETAKGYGASVGLVTYFPYKKGHFTTGITTDLWRMWTKWQDGIDTTTPTSGETYNLVVQPWFDAGYLYHFPNSRTNLGMTLGFGREINVITIGERVGEGWMGSATITLNYILRS